MITVYNSQNYAQQWFFDKAFTELKVKGLLTDKEIEIGRFTSLDGYFAHMADLLATNPNYLMIPSDEQPFVINANTRAISIPSDFSKCAGVMGDDMCEIVTFTIDRYFDYVDLANTNICIQWTTKQGNGISHIGLIDYETVPGKIRFGWPLTSALTSEAGNIIFAVRFFKKDQNEKIVYVLNTKTASIPIVAGLKITGNDITIEDNTIELFDDFVSNSNNPSYPIPAPVYFARPGKDLPKQAAIDNDPESETFDSLTLTAEAITSDNGHIEYNWYYVPPKTEEQLEEIIKIDPNDVRFNINESYLPIDRTLEDGTLNNKRVGGKQYFRQVGGEFEGALAYSLVTDKDLPDEQLYERITTLTLPAISDTDPLYQDITGQYYVTAVNNVGAREIDVGGETIKAMNSTNPIMSSICKVPSPLPITIIKDLNDNMFINNGEAQLNIKLNADEGHPDRTYTWSYSNNAPDELNEISEQSGRDRETLIASAPGWYQVNVVSKLNRKEEVINSNICRVINPVQKPTLTAMKYGIWQDDNLENANNYFADESNFEEMTSAEDLTNAVDRTNIVRLLVKVKVDNIDLNTNPNLLLSDNLTYTWYVNQPDVDRELTEEDYYSDLNPQGLIFNGAELHKNYLDVFVGTTAYSYYCVVTNTLAGESKSWTAEDYNKENGFDFIFEVQ